MNEEERKKGEVAPEVEAAWGRFEGILRALLEAVENRQPKCIVESLAKSVGGWAGVVLDSDDVRAAFWDKVRRDVDFWQVAVKKDLDDRNLVEAVASARNLTNSLLFYARILGLEIPPEEKEASAAEAPSATEEVTAEVEEPPVEEGTPLKVLGLSKRVYNLLAKHFQPLLGRSLFVEDILAILDDESRGEDFLLSGCVKNFGPKALEELKTALREEGFLPRKSSEEPIQSFDEALERIRKPF